MNRRNSQSVGDSKKSNRSLGIMAVALAFTLLLVLSTGTAAAQTDISGCTTPPIQTSGSYEITNDIDTLSGFCIDIAVGDVVIDGNGKRINSTGAGTVGLNVQPYGAIKPTNVTVKNLTITNFDTGVKVENSENVELVNVRVRSANTSISVKDSTDVTIEGATVSETDTGVDVNASNDVTVRGSMIRSTPSIPVIIEPPDPIDPPLPPFGTSSVGTQSNGGGGPGIFLNETRGAVVKNNTVRDFEQEGVLVTAGNTLSKGSNKVIDNEVVNNSQGILVAVEGPSSPNKVLDNEVRANELGIGVVDLSPPFSRNEVSGNELKDNGDGIVVVSQKEDIIDNEVVNSTRFGIGASAAREVNVSENFVNNSGRSGILLQGSFNNLEDNVVKDNGDAGIQLKEPSGIDTGNNTLVNNTATGNQTHGIWLRGTDDNELRDNTANENDVSGIYLNGTSTGNELRDNTANGNGRLTGPGTYGIWLDGNSSDNEVIGNEASDNGIDSSTSVPSAGIYLSGSSGGLAVSSTDDVGNNTVVGNTVTGAKPSPTQRYGIWLSGTSDNEVRENTANENIEAGIYMDGESTDNEIVNNTANKNGHAAGGGPGFGTYGIWLERGSKDNEVVGNEAFDNGIGGSTTPSAGIYLGGAGGPSRPASVKNNTVIDNTVGSSPSGNQTYGIWLLGAEDNRVVDNLAEGNNESGIYLGGRVIGGETKNNTLVNNTARDSEYGIWLVNAFDNDVSESLVENNHEGIVVEEEPVTFSGKVGTESVGGSGNSFTDDVSRNNDWAFVVESVSLSPISLSSTRSSLPVTNLSIGASTEPGTTISFNADDVRLGSVDTPEPNPANLENISRYFRTEPLSGEAFLNVSLSYEDDDVSGVNESTLGLQRFVGSQWVGVPGSSLDTTKNLVSANLTGFGASDFGAFGEPDGGFDLGDYRNQQGEVDTGGLQDAISDFIQQKIDTGDLQAVIQAFIQS